MNTVSLSYFYQLGFKLNSMTHLRDDVPGDLRHGITYRAWEAVETFVESPQVKEILPKSYAKAALLVPELRRWASGVYEGRTIVNYDDLRRTVESLSVTLVDELDSTFNYTVTDKGNLSIAKLVEGASKGYGDDIITLLDDSVTNEIDEAGRCLAFAVYTACGFHILRSVEICVKAYIHASTGSLPNIARRNWGEYIDQLTKMGASANLTDLIKVLKAKRNPLMHPQDKLLETDAIDILCICQAVTGSLVEEIKKKSLDAKFVSSLRVLPTL